jgi:hypothetical protein
LSALPTDPLQASPEVDRDRRGRRGREDRFETQTVDSEGVGGPSPPQVRLPGVAGGVPALDLPVLVSPSVSDLNDPVRTRRPIVVAEPRRLGVDRYDLAPDVTRYFSPTAGACPHGRGARNGRS